MGINRFIDTERLPSDLPSNDHAVDMFNTFRASESRARRPLPDLSLPPQRTRVVPSSSRIDLSLSQLSAPPSSHSAPSSPPSTSSTLPSSDSPLPSHSLFYSICQSFSSFLLFYILHLTPTSHLFFILIPASAASFFAFVLASRKTIPAFNIYFSRPAPRTAVLFVAALHIYAIIATAQATLWLGPLRALIAFAAYPTFSRLIFTLHHAFKPSTRRHSSSTSPARLALAPLFLTTLALVLLTHDATGGRIPPSSANHVLRIPVVRIILDRVPHNLRNQTFSSRRIRRRLYSKSQYSSMFKQQSSTRHQSKRKDTNFDSQSISNRVRNARRTLSVIVSSGSTSGSGIEAIDNNTTNSTSMKLKQSETKEQTIEKHPIAQLNTTLTDPDTPPFKNHLNGSFGDVEENSDPLPLTYSTAIVAIFLAVSSPFANRIAIDFSFKLGADEGNPLPFLLLVYAACTVFSLFFFTSYGVFISLPQMLFFPKIPFDMWWYGAFVGLLFFVLPTGIRFQSSSSCRRNLRAQRQAVPSLLPSNMSTFKFASSIPSALLLYPVTILTLLGTRVSGLSSFTRAEELSFFSISSGLLFTIVARAESVHTRGRSQNNSLLLPGGQQIEIPIALTRRWTLFLRQTGRRIREALLTISQVVADIEENRMSWQVLNFLMLQSGMAVAEVIYASVTRASGLFSISTDNIFCSIALGSGLFAIRMSTRKPSTMFSYGYFRVESICGFANGVLLIYVATLIVLESFERSGSQGYGGIGRAFSVCLFGIVGNVLGLYFFPPETRGENHNVQGIYLHIVTNTLAFSSMAVSTVTRALVPDWHLLDIGMACIVACGVVGFAVPLIIKSGRLLMLMVSTDKRGKLKSVEERLKGISGVRRMHGLRVWNLTPNRLIASVKLEVENDSENLHSEVLSNARSAFTIMGIVASECTIQISTQDFHIHFDKPTDGGTI